MKTKARQVELTSKDRMMLELLATGASNKLVARRMGYRDGTMRVYLHGLYRKLGVPNKTNAVIWHHAQTTSPVGRAQAAAGDEPASRGDETFGDIALRTSLHAALGAMNMFLGPRGRSWEVALRLKGEPPDAASKARQARSRELWEALLRGDFALGKQICDEDRDARLIVESPSDGVLLSMLLLIGGYSSTARRVTVRLASRGKPRSGITVRERTLVEALQQAVDHRTESALESLYRLALDRGAAAPLRQAAMAGLFHAYRAGRDPERARSTADAIWAEAEAVRQELLAMGESPLPREAALPKPGKAIPGTAKRGAGRVAHARSGAVKA